MRVPTGQLGPAARAVVLLTALLGLAYPLALTGVGQAAFGHQADGSLVRHEGRTVGSSLIAQSFAQRPEYFWPRPSAAGESGYDALASGASNLGLDDPILVREVRERREALARADGVAPSEVAPDAVLASGSGLDPQISPAYAAQQVDRVARARGIDPALVRRLVAAQTEGRTLGFLGAPRVEVLALNIALDRAAH